MKDLLDLSSIRQKLNTNIIGKEIRLFEDIDSTNREAMALGASGAKEGTVVLAESQTGGKGRLGRTWYSPKGENLYLSIILRPPVPLSEAQLITVVAAISVAETIRKATDIRPGVKWPNDIFINRRKVAGILTELASGNDKVNYLVVGIGINLNMEISSAPEEIREIAGSLKDISRREIDRAEFLALLLSEFECYYLIFKAGERQRIMDIYTGYSATIGNRIRVRSLEGSIEGIACGFNMEGGLLLKRDSGVIDTILAGDIEHISKD